MRFVFLKREPISRPDGISQFLFAVSDALIRLGHEVVCITTDDADLETVTRTFDFNHYPEMVSLLPAQAAVSPPMWGHRQFWHYAKLWVRSGRKTVDRHRPDLVVLNGALPVRFRQPTALLAHDLEPRSLGGNFGRKLFKAISYRLVRQVLVTCPELAGPVARDCLMSPRGYRVIPTCLDLGRYAPLSRQQRSATILHVGMQHHKQPQKTLQAFTQMRRREARLVIVGKRDSEFEGLVSALPSEVRQRIELPGMVSAAKLKQLLASARAVSAPSFYHHPVASPTVLEALASHTPAVVSPNISSLVAHPGENCFVESAPELIAQRFDAIFGDDALWDKLSAGCEHTKTRFDSRWVAKEYIQLADELRLR